MRILGIDYGKRVIGLAMSVDRVIETRPLLKGEEKKILAAIASLCKKEKVERVVMGISEGKTARATRKFAKKLTNILKLPVELVDETLTTKDARKLRVKKERVDSIAAAILLERFWLKKGGS